MERKLVTKSGKNQDGDITALCGGSYNDTKAQAIRNIETGQVSYYVAVEAVQTVHVVNHPKYGKYLTTGADCTRKNNLDNLPNC